MARPLQYNATMVERVDMTDALSIYVCGLTGTITGTIIPLIDRGFIPDLERIRGALGVPPETRASVFSEHYDTEPVINIKDPTVIETLRARMQAALAKTVVS